MLLMGAGAMPGIDDGRWMADRHFSRGHVNPGATAVDVLPSGHRGLIVALLPHPSPAGEGAATKARRFMNRMGGWLSCRARNKRSKR